MEERNGTFSPDRWLRRVCEGTGVIYKEGERLVCKVRQGKIAIDSIGIVIETPDSEVSSPWKRIRYCEVYEGKHKKMGLCKYKGSGGIFFQMDPHEDEMLVMASRGPLHVTVEAAKNEAPEIKF